MALGATVYKAQLSISDLDRNWYGEPVLTLARHPSETETRLMLRVLAWCMRAGEKLEFGRGLSTDGDPALWELDDTGAIIDWVELGVPDLRTEIFLRSANLLSYSSTMTKRRLWEVWLHAT